MNFAIRNYMLGDDHWREIKVAIRFIIPSLNLRKIKIMGTAIQWEGKPTDETVADDTLKDLISKVAEKWMSMMREDHADIEFEYIENDE